MEQNGTERNEILWSEVQLSAMKQRFHSIVWIFFIPLHTLKIGRNEKMRRLNWYTIK
jgi:hypothetical protein